LPALRHSPSSGLPDGSISQKGIVQLSNSVASTSEADAATPKAVKTVNDKTITNAGDINTLDNQVTTNTASILTNTNNISGLTTNLATTDAKVVVNETNIAANTLAASNAQTTADAALPKAGGTMTGNIVMGGTTVIDFSDSQTFPTDIPVDPSQLPAASVNQAGVVQLTNDKTSTSETLAPTADALSATYTVATTALTNANAALPKAGGTMTGDITFSDTQTFPAQTINPSDLPDASISQQGIVQLSDAVDSTSITLAGTANAVASAYDRGTLGVTNAANAQSAAGAALAAATAADTKASTALSDAADASSAASTADGKAVAAQTTATAALPKSGGTMTGLIVFDDNQTFPGAEGNVKSVNSVVPGVDGNITLTASDVDSVSATTGGTFGGFVLGVTPDAGSEWKHSYHKRLCIR
jgi:hypothetical protein